MSVIQFESVVEGNVIRIPEEYVNAIQSGTKVTVRSNDRINGIPFELVAGLTQKTPKLGCMKGKIWMSDDFDDPLDDFNEYM